MSIYVAHFHVCALIFSVAIWVYLYPWFIKSLIVRQNCEDGTKDVFGFLWSFISLAVMIICQQTLISEDMKYHRKGSAYYLFSWIGNGGHIAINFFLRSFFSDLFMASCSPHTIIEFHRET